MRLNKNRIVRTTTVIILLLELLANPFSERTLISFQYTDTDTDTTILCHVIPYENISHHSILEYEK